MKKICLITCISILLFLLHSCEKDANVKLPVVENKLVLTCFLSPSDKDIHVRVSTSKPLYNNPDNWKYVPVTNATVMLSSGSSAVTLPFDKKLQHYVISASLFKINAGNSYQLSVSTPDGKFAQAFTSIPAQNTTFSATANADPNTANTYFFHGIWQDQTGTKDFYRVDLQHIVDTSLSYVNDHLIKDDASDGETFRRDWEFTIGPGGTDSVFASLLVLTPELYDYLDRLNKTSTDGDPFSEPVPMYTNIEGGLGVFGGYNPTRIRILP